MGESDIAKILEDNYPKWMCYRDVIEFTDISRNNVFKSLKRLSKRNEVEIRIKIIPNSKQRSITHYRIKNGK